MANPSSRSRGNNLRREKKKSEQQGSPLWMTTYSDMVTLLLTFFILLYSISVIDVERFQRVIISIQTSFMGYTGIMQQTPDPYESTGEALAHEEGFFSEAAMLERAREAEAILSEVESFLAEIGLEGEVELRLDERGIVMELPDYIFFERARADLRPEARQVLDKFSELFARLDRNIIIEGHTCNLPINVPEFPSNWELSVIRSVRVTRYLVEEQGLDPHRLTATGYGEFQPLEPNLTPEARARNRRVTIVISILTQERHREAL
jgi:chemotaxis protein MotB